MAPVLRQLAPSRLQIREGGGPAALFGLPFLLAGILVTLTGAGVIPILNASDVPRFAWPVLLMMGLVFILVGGAVFGLRSWATVDTAQRHVIKEWGLFVPMHAEVHRLDGYSVVVIRFDAGDSDTADRFPVSLKSESGAHLPLCSFTQYTESRACALAVSAHLGLDIEDASTGHPTRLSAREADLPLQHRLRLAPRERWQPDRPSKARSEISETGSDVRIVIPSPRLHPAIFALMLTPVAVPVLVLGPLAQFFRDTNTPEPVGWVFLGWLILGFGILPLAGALGALARSRVARTIVTVSTEGVRIDERRLWNTKPVVSLSASEILDVDYDASAAINSLVKGRGLTIKTRQGLTTFGGGLADDETRYLHSVVRWTIAGWRPLGPANSS